MSQPLKLPGAPRISSPSVGEKGWTAIQRYDIKAIWDDLFRAINGNATITGLQSQTTSGTLFPDEKPTGLGTADKNLVFFYSTEFDHLYVWNGSTWNGVGYDGGMVVLRTGVPTSNGWHEADGTASVRRSLPDGTTSVITVPTVTTTPLLSYMRL